MSLGEWVKANNHWIGLAGLITGTVIGVAAIAYAVLTTPHAAISYKAKAISLVDATRGASALKVTDQSGKKITSNVYAIEVAVWNSGDISLGTYSDRVREPLSISLSPNTVSIVEAVIQRTTLEKNLKAVQQSPSLIQIKWEQFDPSDAVRILIIYAADEPALFTVAGKFVGVRIKDRSDYNDLTISKPSGFEELKSEFRRNPYRISVMFILIILVTVMMVISTVYRGSRYVSYIIFLIQFGVVGAAFYDWTDGYFHGPPI